MERFAFKIDKALRANLGRICRLCGIDNPEKVPILTRTVDVVDVDAEPELNLKVKMLIGLHIAANDKLPQEMCVLCVDKINDFYEFREMCLSTQRQTRRLLGLKIEEELDPFVDVKVPIGGMQGEEPKRRGRKRKNLELNPPSVLKSEVKYEDLPGSTGIAENKRRRKQVLIYNKRMDQLDIKPKMEIKEEPMPVTAPRLKHKEQCNICNEGFVSMLKLNRHVHLVHVPDVPRYTCLTCNETLKKIAEIKHHQAWHKMTKTPYKCGMCGQTVRTLYSYSRHLREHSQEAPAAVLDRVCPQCGDSFVTNFLYNTHMCAQLTRVCGGCNIVLGADTKFLAHAARCPKAYYNYTRHIMPAAAATDTADCSVRIKNENEVEAATAYEHDSTSISLLNLQTPLTRLPANTLAEGAIVSIPCSGSAANEPAIRVKQEMLDEAEQEEDVTAAETEDNHQWEASSSGDDCDAARLVEVNIKQEPEDELKDAAACGKTPTLKLKIKKEHGTLSSTLMNDGGVADADRKQTKKKKRKNVDGESGASVNGEDDAAPVVVSCIKQEHIDAMEDEGEMVAMSQFQVNQVHNEATTLNDVTAEAVPEQLRADDDILDVKPNRAELDRLMAVTNSSSANGGAAVTTASAQPTSLPHCGLRITAVRSGVTLDQQPEIFAERNTYDRVFIKSEPCDVDDRPDDVPREVATDGPSQLATATTSQQEQQQYDFCVAQIKQEPELELSDVHASRCDANVQKVAESLPKETAVEATGMAFSSTDESSVDEKAAGVLSVKWAPPPVVNDSAATTSAEDESQHEKSIVTSADTGVGVPEKVSAMNTNTELQSLSYNNDEVKDVGIKTSTTVTTRDMVVAEVVNDATLKAYTSNASSTGTQTPNSKDSTAEQKSVANSNRKEELKEASQTAAIATAIDMVFVVGAKEATLGAQPINALSPSAESLHPDGLPDATATVVDELQQQPATLLVDEAQQNALNQGVAASLAITPVAASLAITSVAIEAEAAVCEETENIHNERQQQQQLHLQSLLHDDRNVNEIAENNNNANIERELHDNGAGDGNDGAQLMAVDAIGIVVATDERPSCSANNTNA